MKILIDADGCPVVKETIALAQDYEIPLILVCDTSHEFYEPYATILMADKGRDQSDYLLLKHVQEGDIVITQDYGLATLVLAKKAYALSQNGLQYIENNIDALLHSRHEHAKKRKHKNYSSTPKRTLQNDKDFINALENLISELIKM